MYGDFLVFLVVWILRGLFPLIFAVCLVGSVDFWDYFGWNRFFFKIFRPRSQKSHSLKVSCWPDDCNLKKFVKVWTTSASMISNVFLGSVISTERSEYVAKFRFTSVLVFSYCIRFHFLKSLQVFEPYVRWKRQVTNLVWIFWRRFCVNSMNLFHFPVTVLIWIALQFNF